MRTPRRSRGNDSRLADGVRRSIIGAIVAMLASDNAGAQSLPAAAGSGRALVSGIVYDSLASRPLGGATLQLVDADSVSGGVQHATTDSLGRFSFTAPRAGRYLLAFFHPRLDSLGLEMSARQVTTDGTSAVEVNLALPSPRTLLASLCGSDAADDDALILGFVRDARDRRGVDSATVTARWSELTLTRGAMDRSVVRRDARTPETGWFTICGAPSGGSVVLSAQRGADSTIQLEIEVPTTGFLHRDLYFGNAQPVPPSTDERNDSTLVEVKLTGGGRLTGVVVAAQGGRPLDGARVGIANGPQTRADAEGRWTLTAAPTGTRTLEVRAVAHYPVSQPVDVVEGAAAVRVEMMTMQSVLDTVRITAKRLGSGRLIEFMNRKRSSGSGRFLTSADIASRGVGRTSDLFRTIPGMQTQQVRNGNAIVTMRGGAGGRCQPVVFVNGFPMSDVTTDDIDMMSQPGELIGVEVYSAAGAPGQFIDWKGCGSIVLWTR
ncbi:MAG TPA: carboxypeptidase regulatory-like domain-containing protein [Gemmatimonadaceae bacterium]|nr:carboxypeptidase regulatory-like domain-containing protein [Gemmatimonadaceae bacterium]